MLIADYFVKFHVKLYEPLTKMGATPCSLSTRAPTDTSNQPDVTSKSPVSGSKASKSRTRAVMLHGVSTPPAAHATFVKANSCAPKRVHFVAERGAK